MRGRRYGAVCAALALAVLLSGCSFPGIGKKNRLSVSGTTVAGQVVAVNDKTVSLTLGHIDEPASASGAGSAAAASASASASPSPSASGSVSAVAPTVNNESTAIAAQQSTAKPSASAGTSAAPQASPAASAEEGYSGQDTVSGANAAKGVTVNTATFTLGVTPATLQLNDDTMLFKDDGVTRAALSDIKTDEILAIELDAKGAITKITIRSLPRLITVNGVSYLAANEYGKDGEMTSQKISSKAADENAAIVDNGAEVGFDGASIERVSADSAGGAASAAYGVGAGLLAADGKAFVKGSTVTTDAAGGSGLFSYGSGRTYAADTAVSTKQADSAGLSSSAGGKMYVWDMTVSTAGENSAAIAAAAGGKTVADGGKYSTEGKNSPAVSSRGETSLNGAALTAKASEAARVEGANALYVFDSDLSGGMTGAGARTVLVYNSGEVPSGGVTAFKMTGGSLASAGGGVIYATNAKCSILLSKVNITAAKDESYFLRCTGNADGWGTAGSNGAVCRFTGDSQKMAGNVLWDSISQLSFYLQNGSTLTGAVKDDESNAGGAKGSGFCDMYIGGDSVWVVTADSSVTNLYCSGRIVDGDGKTVAIKDSDGKRLVKGDSKYTVTVRTYKNSADMSGSLALSQWKDRQVARPSGM